MTEPLLPTAYGMRTEVIYERHNGRDRARAIVAKRPLSLPAAALNELDSPLAQSFASETRGHLFLVTELPGVGKTAWCGELIRLAARASHHSPG